MTKSRKRVDYREIHKDMVQDTEKKFQEDPKLLKMNSKIDNHVLKVRFLPNLNTEDMPFVALHSHKIYLSKDNYMFSVCHKTVGAECPICRTNWDDVSEEEVKNYRLYPTTTYFANVLVISDSDNHDNDGKVMMFCYPKTVQKYLMELLMGDPEIDQTPLYFYDLDYGCDIVCKKTGQKIKTKYVTRAMKTSKVDEDLDGLIEKETLDVDSYIMKNNPIVESSKLEKEYKDFLRKNDLME